jgi:hypothetical protein
MERLTKRTNNGMAFLTKVKDSEQDVESPYPNTLKAILDSIQKLAEYEDAEEQGLLIKLPCKVGDTVYVDSRTVPTQNMEFEEATAPPYFEATVVSFRKNAKSQYFKLKIRAKWLHEWIDPDCGPDSCFYEVEKYFTYPVSAIGITIFLTREAAKEALKGSVSE